MPSRCRSYFRAGTARVGRSRASQALLRKLYAASKEAARILVNVDAHQRVCGHVQICFPLVHSVIAYQPADHVEEAVGQGSIHPAGVTRAVDLDKRLGLVNAAHSRRRLPFDDVAGEGDIGRGLVGDAGEFRVALRGVNIPEEQQAAGMRGIQVDLVAGADIATSMLPPQAPCEVTVFSTPLSGAVTISARSQRPADLASDVHHGLSIVECTGTTGDVTDYGRKVLVDLAELR